MPVVFTVSYPNDADVNFDLDYYLKSHMPMVEKIWTPFGLKSWHVLTYPKGSDNPYIVQAMMRFEDDALDKALAAAEAKEIFEDIPKFSNKQPARWTGQFAGKGGKNTW